MAYVDYQRDGDRLSLALAVTMVTLTALSTYLWFSQLLMNAKATTADEITVG